MPYFHFFLNTVMLENGMRPKLKTYISFPYSRISYKTSIYKYFIILVYMTHNIRTSFIPRCQIPIIACFLFLPSKK